MSSAVKSTICKALPSPFALNWVIYAGFGRPEGQKHSACLTNNVCSECHRERERERQIEKKRERGRERHTHTHTRKEESERQTETDKRDRQTETD